MALTYTAVTNPVYDDAKSQSISCMVQFSTFPNPIPFIATPDDPESHGSEIFADCVAGKYGTVGAYVAPKPTPNEQYVAAISKGLAVTCASTPALNGTYSIADSDQSNVNSEAQYITSFQEFTTGTQTMAWADAAGTPHTFPSTVLFMQFAKACAQFVSGCKQATVALSSGQAATFPSNSVELP